MARRARTVAAAASALGVFTLSPALSSPSTGSGEGASLAETPPGRILLERGGHGDRRFYTVDPDGSDLRFLVAGATASLSPDGSKLAVTRARRGVVKLYVGSRRRGRWSLRMLFPGDRHHELGAAWSPDGKWLAVSRSRRPVPHSSRGIDLAASPLDIWRVAPDGRRARKLAGGSRADLRSFRPSWSPDGTLIAFTAVPANQVFRGVHLDESVYVMRADGTGPRRLTSRRGASEITSSQPWSPDGRRLVYMLRRGGIWVMNADGTGRHQIRASRVDLYPVWSPDGTSFAFTRHGTSGEPAVFTMSAGGRNVRRVATGVLAGWSSAPN